MLAKALKGTDRDLNVVLSQVDSTGQRLFWTELRQFAALQIGQQGPRIPLAVGEEIPELVREGLRMIDAKLSGHLDGLLLPDREYFWRILHDVSNEQAAQSAQPVMRAGGGQIQF